MENSSVLFEGPALKTTEGEFDKIQYSLMWVTYDRLIENVYYSFDLINLKMFENQVPSVS